MGRFRPAQTAGPERPSRGSCVERVTAIEPAWPAWKPSTWPRELRESAWYGCIERPGATLDRLLFWPVDGPAVRA